MTIVAEYDSPMTNGKYSDLEWIETADRIVLAPSTCDDSEVRPLLQIARAAGIKMSVVPACSGMEGRDLNPRGACTPNGFRVSRERARTEALSEMRRDGLTAVVDVDPQSL
jgi:hypothetical protein